MFFQVINIMILDKNDNWPEFEKEIGSITIDELTPLFTDSLRVNVTDLDQVSNHINY